MKYFDGESEVYVSGNKELVLTTHRVRRTVSKGPRTSVTSISLGELSGCQMASFDHRLLFYFSIICLVVAGMSALGKSDDAKIAAIGCGLSGAVFMSIYFWTRAQGLLFTSRGGVKITFKSKAGLDACTTLIDQVEQTREVYYKIIEVSSGNTPGGQGGNQMSPPTSTLKSVA